MDAQDQTFSQATDLFGRAVRSVNFILDNWAGWLALGAAIWLVLLIRSRHQLLGELDERCEASFADIDAMLAERHGLIPNLVETVKAFAGQEHKVLKDVIDARARAMATAGSARMTVSIPLAFAQRSQTCWTRGLPAIGCSGFAGRRVDA